MGTQADDFAALDAMSTSELREKAFEKADNNRDIGFFWDLVKHLGSGAELGADDGSAGGLGEEITGVIGLVRDLLGKHETAAEPMLRARYIDYLRQSD